MSFLNLNPAEGAPSNFRQSVTQGALIGGSIIGGGSVVIAAIELIKKNPDKGFALLERWGPWFFLALFSVWVARDLLTRMLDVLSEIGDRFANSMDKIAVEQEKLAGAARDTATAQQRSADKDDRNHERMSTLVDYSGQQSRQALEAVTAMHSTLETVAAQVAAMAAKKDG